MLLSDRKKLVLDIVEFRENAERVFRIVDLACVVEGIAPEESIIRAEVVIHTTEKVVFGRNERSLRGRLEVAAQITRGCNAVRAKPIQLGDLL